MSISLVMAKAKLRVIQDDQDLLIQQLIDQAEAWTARFIKDDLPDPEEPDLDGAMLLLIEYWFYPDEEYELDEIYQVPRSVAALAGPFRMPTIA